MDFKTLIRSQKARIIAGLVGIYLIAFGISFALFSYLKTTPGGIISPTELSGKRASIDLSGPKTEECPLNGKLYTKAEHDIWMSRRPLGIMVENHEESRPQSGLSNADVVYEAVAEGGITRFLAVYYCGASAEEVQVGPVRSARTYFLDWISEYGDAPLYAHVGGANKPGQTDALGQIREYGWDLYNDLNQFSIGFPTFWRDYERLGRPVATEHTMYSTTDKLWDVAKDRELTNKNDEGERWDENFAPWRFTDGSPSAGSTSKISFPFWAGYSQYFVTWEYDSASNSYKRFSGGQSHTDLNNGVQLEASNVIVMFTTERGPINELKHMLYGTTGSGEALIFQNGDVIEGTWKKPSRISRTKFMDNSGREIELVRGPVWIEVLANGTDVDY